MIAVPCIFYLPTLDYLNLPREIFWVTTGSFILCYHICTNSRIYIHFDKLNKTVCLFLFWALISVCWAWQPYLSWPRWGIMAIAFITFMVVRTFSKKDQDLLLWVLAIQGFLGTCLGYLQLHEVEPFNKILQTQSPGIVMGHRNVAAEYMLITIGASLALIRRTYPIYVNAFLVLNVIFVLNIIIESKCRGVMIGFLSAIAFTVLLMLKFIKSIKTRIIILASIPIFLSLFIFIAITISPALKKSFTGEKLGSIKMRTAHYSNTLMMAKENLPTGVGIGNFAINYTSYITAWVPDKPYSDKLILRNVHSDPLEVLAELGPVGLVLFLLLIYFALIDKNAKSWQNWAIKFIIIAQMINACVNFPFQVIQTQLAMAIMLGILHRYSEDEKDNGFVFPRNLTIKFISFCLVIFLLQFNYKRIAAHTSARKGLDLLMSKQHPKALIKLREAVNHTPRNVDIQMLLAYCLKEMGYRTESSSIAENVLGLFHGYLPALNLIGLNALDIKDLNRAIKAFEKSYELQPHQEATALKLAISYSSFAQEIRMRGYFLQAFETEEKLFKLTSEHYERGLRKKIEELATHGHPLAGEIASELPIFGESEQPMSQIIERYLVSKTQIEVIEFRKQLPGKKNEEIILRMVVDQLSLKNIEKAESLFNNLPASYHNPRKHFVKASIQLAKNKIIEAVETLDKAIITFPEDPVLKNYRENIIKTRVNSKDIPQH